jgi:hypothetical protein
MTTSCRSGLPAATGKRCTPQKGMEELVASQPDSRYIQINHRNTDIRCQECPEKVAQPASVSPLLHPRPCPRVSLKSTCCSGRDRTNPTPKEQPPRKLSGKRTANRNQLLERDAFRVSADGIIISGKGTEGAHEQAEKFSFERCASMMTQKRTQKRSRTRTDSALPTDLCPRSCALAAMSVFAFRTHPHHQACRLLTT